MGAMEPTMERRITVRISDADRAKLDAEARRRKCTEGAMVRALIREQLAKGAPKR